MLNILHGFLATFLFFFSLLGSGTSSKVPVAVVSPQSRHKTELYAKTLAVSAQKDEQDPQDIGSQLSLLKQSSV